MKRLFVQFLAGILLLLLAIGVFAIPAAAECQVAFPLTVTDGLGRQVAVLAPPQRIVSLAPSHTEGLFAIGAGDKVVGVTTYDNYPPHSVFRIPHS